MINDDFILDVLETSNRCGQLNNLPMSDETYLMKHQVLEIISDARRRIPELPEIKVRITEPGEKILGAARPWRRIVWITSDVFEGPYLLCTVLHELLHAVYGLGHEANCPLMCPSIRKPPISDSLLWEVFTNKAKSSD